MPNDTVDSTRKERSKITSTTPILDTDVDIGDTIQKGLRIVDREIDRIKVRSNLDEMERGDHKTLQEYLKLLAQLPGAMRQIGENKKRLNYGNDPAAMSEEELMSAAEKASAELKARRKKEANAERKALPFPTQSKPDFEPMEKPNGDDRGST